MRNIVTAIFLTDGHHGLPLPVRPADFLFRGEAKAVSPMSCSALDTLSESTKTLPFSTTETSSAYAAALAAQAGFVQEKFFSKSESNFRFSTGPVLHF
jgi:hypothetical protein